MAVSLTVACCILPILAWACASSPEEAMARGWGQSAHCDSVAVQSARAPSDSVDVPARPIVLPLPLPPPESVRGRTVNLRFMVDPAGRASRVDVEGIDEGDYLTGLERHMSNTRFIPAMRGECRVYSVALLTMEL